MRAEAAAAASEANAKQAALRAREEAAKDQASRAQAATAALRAQLLQQLNDVLQTTDTPRGSGGEYGRRAIRAWEIRVEYGRTAETGQGFPASFKRIQG